MIIPPIPDRKMRVVDWMREHWPKVHVERALTSYTATDKETGERSYCAVGFVCTSMGLDVETLDIGNVPGGDDIASVNDTFDSKPESVLAAVEEAWNGWSFDELFQRIQSNEHYADPDYDG